MRRCAGSSGVSRSQACRPSAAPPLAPLCFELRPSHREERSGLSLIQDVHRENYAIVGQYRRPGGTHRAVWCSGRGPAGDFLGRGSCRCSTMILALILVASWHLTFWAKTVRAADTSAGLLILLIINQMRSAIANKFLTEQRCTRLEPARIEIEIPANAPAGSSAPLTRPVAFDRMW
jgi:hypothetical protein